MLAQVMEGRYHPQRGRMTDARPSCGWTRSSTTWASEGCSPNLRMGEIIHNVRERRMLAQVVDGRDQMQRGRMKDARRSCGWTLSSETWANNGCSRLLAQLVDGRDHPQLGRMTDDRPSCGWARSSATWANDGCSPKLWMDAFTHNLGE